MGIEYRHFHHYDQWFHVIANMDKLEALSVSDVHEKFKGFVKDVILPKNVPQECFIERSKRASSRSIRNCTIVQNPSRYSYIIKSALKHQGDRQRHYVVLKYLVRHPLTNHVICELPAWKKNEPPNDPSAGHIDIIEFMHATPHIMVWDYKPYALMIEPPSGQLNFYQTLLAQILDVPIYEIGMGYFDEVAEIMLVEV